ncbi:unnamed protein product [Rotaria sp. Silwood1]|nr:unnamed protein product [Rotaria sp. Silwood1]CAF4750660.1 unnamed protein product [Rotaria sp. Silwood1]
MEPMSIHNNNEKRVVSFFIWDPELERKIDCEVKIIDGSSKLLNVATTLEQTIECHKALVLSQQRMLAFMNEIQRKQENLLKRDNMNLEPTKATVILSDIRLPLIWTTMKAKSEKKKFAVFCLARIGCEIIDTKMKSIDKKSTEILFTDKLIFKNISHDFQLYLEVYALNKTLTLSSSVKDFANRYSYYSTYGKSYKLTRKIKEINSINHKSSVQQQSKFILIARTIFTKESVYKMAKVRYLRMERIHENPLMQLPIHTSFIARFTIEPLCYTSLATYAGILKNNNISYSCILTAGFLKGEEITLNKLSDHHQFSICITSETIISLCNKQLSFIIGTQGFDEVEFIVQDLFILKNWIRALQQHILDIHDIHQTNISSQSMVNNTIDQSNNIDHIIDENDIYHASLYQIRV